MNYTLPTSIRLPRNLKDFLQRRADQENRKLSQMIIHILEMYRISHRKRAEKKSKDDLTGYSGIMRDEK